MNELGTNLANILDDTQMGYMNLEQYADLTRIERKQTPPNTYTFDTSKNAVRDAVLDKAFKDEWDTGVRMKWLLTSSECQKPSTNWRQDINKPDHTMKKLASYQFNPSNANAQTGAAPNNDACPVNPGEFQIIMKEHYNSMNTSKSDIVKEWTKFAENEVGPQTNAALEAIRMCNQQGWANDLIRLAKEEEVDPMFMLSLFATESGCEAGKEGGGILQLSAVKKEQEAAKSANKKYNVTYATEIEGAIKAWKNQYTQLEAGGNPMLAATVFCAHGKIGGSIGAKATRDQRFNNEWINDAKTDYKDSKNTKGANDMSTILQYWPRVVYFYEAFLNMDKKKSVMSTGSTDFDFDFPFADIDLDKVYFTSDYHSSNKGNIKPDELKKEANKNNPSDNTDTGNNDTDDGSNNPDVNNPSDDKKDNQQPSDGSDTETKKTTTRWVFSRDAVCDLLEERIPSTKFGETVKVSGNFVDGVLEMTVWGYDKPEHKNYKDLKIKFNMDVDPPKITSISSFIKEYITDEELQAMFKQITV